MLQIQGVKLPRPVVNGKAEKKRLNDQSLANLLNVAGQLPGVITEKDIPPQAKFQDGLRDELKEADKQLMSGVEKGEIARLKRNALVHSHWYRSDPFGKGEVGLYRSKLAEGASRPAEFTLETPDTLGSYKSIADEASSLCAEALRAYLLVITGAGTIPLAQPQSGALN